MILGRIIDTYRVPVLREQVAQFVALDEDKPIVVNYDVVTLPVWLITDCGQQRVTHDR